MKNILNKIKKPANIHYHHEEIRKSTPFEITICMIIAILSIIHLVTWEDSKSLDFLIPILTLLLLGVKIKHIIKEKGTVLEDYALILVMVIFLVMYLVLKGNLNATLTIIFVFILFYSAGLMIWLKSRIVSKKITHFIVSYVTTVILTVLLFAGAYTSGTGHFLESGVQKELKFREALYFSAVTFTTVGYGDISPLGVNRAFAAIEALLGITINTALIGYVLASGKNSQE